MSESGMDRDPETASPGEALAELARQQLQGWRIPEGIPMTPDTAILPLRPDPEMVRTASRVLHTLLVRTCPDTLFLLGTRRGDSSDDTPDEHLVTVGAAGSFPTPLGAVSIDAKRAPRLGRILGDRAVLVGVEGLDPPEGESGLETIPILLQVLAPGCRVLPILLPSDCPPALALEVGQAIVDEFGDDNISLAAPLELSRAVAAEKERAREQLRVQDAEWLRPILGLDLEGCLDRIGKTAGDEATGALEQPAVLLAALAHAHGRGAALGHLIEYVRTAEGPLPGAGSSEIWNGRAGVIF